MATLGDTQVAGPPRVASITGLVIAWGGTLLLISPMAERFFGDPSRFFRALIGQALFWLLAALVIAIVVFWERRPLASLWLQPLRWQSIAWGLALVAVHVVVLFPAGEWVRTAAGLPGLVQGMDAAMAFPLSVRIVGIVTAGVVEELLFRGYTITRLTLLTGNVWLAAALAVVGFGALHIPGWGWGFVIGGLFGGVVTTAFFVWSKDLLAMMVFHVSVDALGMVIAPMFGEWWLYD